MQSFSERILSINPSPVMAFRNTVMELEQQGHKLIRMVGGEPDFITPGPIIEAAYQSMRNGDTTYALPQGIIPLREKIAKKLREENNIPVEADNIIVTAGSKSGIINSLFCILNSGDEVLILDPSWSSYTAAVQLCGGVPVNVALSLSDNFAITREKLEPYASGKTKALIVNSPNNPTGRVMTQEEADVLAAFAVEHDSIIITDEVYEKIIYDDSVHISLASNPEIRDRVITINGFSKAYAMCGWRLGYIAADKKYIKEIMKLQVETITCATSFVQQAAVTALDCAAEVAAMTESYLKRRDAITEGLNRIKGVTCRKPEGAFYVIPHIEHGNMNSDELSLFLLREAKVGAMSGKIFGQGMEKCLRMSYACSMEENMEAVQRIGAVLGWK